MAALHLLSLSLLQPPSLASTSSSSLQQKPQTYHSLRKSHFFPLHPPNMKYKISTPRAIEIDPSNLDPPKPEILLEFISGKAGADGCYPVEKAKAISGEKLLRNIMLDNKIELYATYGKVMNCGGGGSCGTCIVEITDGKELLNERTDTELRYLKKKPDSWRLACQTIVGNKENAGKVVVQCLPQWKK
ncbi:photosynthetic NDH subunit of subcomplex B 3, chloroplastic-like isoform X1 [Tasmannia lanceolata]|uniref:photosynthetic NDH subunit of subcomplex B 3, chloroplastic-like isoform X1 n=1 Tax=Tasmannia lanceolata TaxID=3420 RepID=UPI00406321D0